MSDLQKIRKTNLRALVREWEGPSNLARKLGYGGPSFVSQMLGTHKPVTEKTARLVEEKLDLPAGWLDTPHDEAKNHGKVDMSLVSRILQVAGAALDDAGVRLAPSRLADLVVLLYDDAIAKG